MTGAAPAVELFRQMLRMRRFEQSLADLWDRGLISGELHLGIGEEGIVAGVLVSGTGGAMALLLLLVVTSALALVSAQYAYRLEARLI